MREQIRCGAKNGDRQCRATAHLTRVAIETAGLPQKNLLLPPVLVIQLCPRHFIWKMAQGGTR